MTVVQTDSVKSTRNTTSVCLQVRVAKDDDARRPVVIVSMCPCEELLLFTVLMCCACYLVMTLSCIRYGCTTDFARTQGIRNKN